MVALLAALVGTPLVISYFRERGFGQPIREEGPETVAAFIAEPVGSTYHDPRTGKPIRSGPIADIRTSEPVGHGVNGSFRELMVQVHDSVPHTVNIVTEGNPPGQPIERDHDVSRLDPGPLHGEGQDQRAGGGGGFRADHVRRRQRLPAPGDAGIGADLFRDGLEPPGAADQFWISPAGPAGSSVTSMFNNITHSQLFVLDQDEALEFYVGKLGMEVRNDVDLGFMRWLTIGVPGDEGREVLLEKPGPPSHSEQAGAQVRDLLTKGALGLGFILTTDDCRKTYEELKAKGVELTQEPAEQPYGVDCALRDPFGNHVRITQPAAVPGEITEQVRRRWAGDAPA
jgi:catechol 2,3-dioxygenase-like lactoylglutathione lyase family enzyme